MTTNTIRNNRWAIIDYMGCPLPKLTMIQIIALKTQLRGRYCERCGEYIFNPYPQRKIKHYHVGKHFKYQPIIKKRILIHPNLHLVEWERRFPRVMRFNLSPEEIFYGSMKSSFRILAHRMWSVDEWNIHYPDTPIRLVDGFNRFNLTKPLHNILMTPNLVV